MANLMVFKRAGAVFYAGVSPFTDFQKKLYLTPFCSAVGVLVYAARRAVYFLVQLLRRVKLISLLRLNWRFCFKFAVFDAVAVPNRRSIARLCVCLAVKFNPWHSCNAS